MLIKNDKKRKELVTFLHRYNAFSPELNDLSAVRVTECVLSQRIWHSSSGDLLLFLPSACLLSEKSTDIKILCLKKEKKDRGAKTFAQYAIILQSYFKIFTQLLSQDDFYQCTEVLQSLSDEIQEDLETGWYEGRHPASTLPAALAAHEKLKHTLTSH